MRHRDRPLVRMARAPGALLRASLGARAGGAVGALLAAALLAGCSASDGSGRPALTVYAASSLTEAFDELATVFEKAHPDVDLQLTFAGSQVLRVQIEQGARADVYASANPEHVEALVQEGLVRDGRWFAGNELVIAVPLDNPAGIESFADLPRAERIVLGTEAVPVGRYAREVLVAADSSVRAGFAADVMAHVVSEESNVRLARSKVELGEADAAIVYRTDAMASDRVRTVAIPDGVNVRADYLVGAVLRPDERRDSEGDFGHGAPAELAADWIALLRSDAGREVLERHGFLTR